MLHDADIAMEVTNSRDDFILTEVLAASQHLSSANTFFFDKRAGHCHQGTDRPFYSPAKSQL